VYTQSYKFVYVFVYKTTNATKTCHTRNVLTTRALLGKRTCSVHSCRRWTFPSPFPLRPFAVSTAEQT